MSEWKWYAVLGLDWPAQNNTATFILLCHRANTDHSASTGSVIFSSECTRNRLSATLCSDPLGSSQRSPGLLDGVGGGASETGKGLKGKGVKGMQERGGMEEVAEWKGGRE